MLRFRDLLFAGRGLLVLTPVLVMGLVGIVLIAIGIYFGRSAYGISAASQAYYGIPLAKITAPQAALLAGMIQNPGRYKEQDYMEQRWNYVLDQMVNNQWLTADERAKAKFPTLLDLDKAGDGLA